MKSVLCFGDSLTWGYDPDTGGRLPFSQRWTHQLGQGLGQDVEIIAEGLVNRTTNVDDPVIPGRNGLSHLATCLESHKPLDLVIIMLGTNDLKARLNRSAAEIGESAARVAGAARASAFGPAFSQPAVLLICPPPVDEVGTYAEIFVGAAEKSRQLPVLYHRYAEWVGVACLDASSIASVSPIDGVHLDGVRLHS